MNEPLSTREKWFHKTTTRIKNFSKLDCRNDLWVVHQERHGPLVSLRKMREKTSPRRLWIGVAFLAASMLTGCGEVERVPANDPTPAPTSTVIPPSTNSPPSDTSSQRNGSGDVGPAETLSKDPPQTSGGAESVAPNDHQADLERQLQENEDRLNAERDRLEQERRDRAIAEYEASLAYYASEIDYLQGSIEAMETQRAAAYSNFEADFGVPFVRYNTDCGNSSDFFGCINASAAMPTYEFSIDQAKTNIALYEQARDSLVYPY